MLEVNYIEIIILSIYLILLNFSLKINNFLIDSPSYSVHKIKNKKKIALSGGIFIVSALIYFEFKYTVFISNVFYFFILLVPLGILSDKNILKSPLKRFLIQFFVLLIAVILFEIQINNSRIIFLDYLLSNTLFNFIFTIFCLLVLINGSNFIDGLNGLASGYFLILCLSIVFLNPIDGGILKYSNIFFFISIILVIFLFFNFLNFNFLGDNGIYFLSTIIGYSLIQFSNFNSLYISPFYIVSLLWYPAFENLFSIIRRINKKKIMSDPDNLHLHSLIYLKMKKKFGNVNANNISTVLILLFMLPGFIFSNIFHHQSLYLGVIIFINVLIYLIIYIYLKK